MDSEHSDGETAHTQCHVTSHANGDRTTCKAGKAMPQNTETNGQTYQVFCVSV